MHALHMHTYCSQKHAPHMYCLYHQAHAQHMQSYTKTPQWEYHAALEGRNTRKRNSGIIICTGLDRTEEPSDQTTSSMIMRYMALLNGRPMAIHVVVNTIIAHSTLMGTTCFQDQESSSHMYLYLRRLDYTNHCYSCSCK